MKTKITKYKVLIRFSQFAHKTDILTLLRLLLEILKVKKHPAGSDQYMSRACYYLVYKAQRPAYLVPKIYRLFTSLHSRPAGLGHHVSTCTYAKTSTPSI